jgi:hypothetical protein
MTIPAVTTRRRGQPLVALAMLLIGWSVVRVAIWESPFARAIDAAVERAQGAAPQELGPTQTAVTLPASAVRSPQAERSSSLRASANLTSRSLAGARLRPNQLTVLPFTVGTRMGRPAVADTPFIAQPAVAKTLPPRAHGRLHFSAWTAWREGSGLPRVANGALLPSYGGSQAGFLAQYDVGQGPRRPALHARATFAPDRPQQAEIAAGLGLRPLAAFPVRLLGEARATRVEGRTEIRPAVFAVTETAPLSLPLRLRAEGYAQGGWVGGRYGTIFADGQARVTRDVATAGPVRLHLGAGAWGGAQRFAERLDVGPTVAADLAPLRLTLDYRMRVAGHARPGDGLALTLSTGF